MHVLDSGVLNNYAATTAPGVGDDELDGYQVGSRWIDTSADAAYVCLDASAGAASWSSDTGSANAVTAAAVFATDNAVLRADGTGRGAQASGWTISDTDDLGVGALGDKVIFDLAGSEYITSDSDKQINIYCDGTEMVRISKQNNTTFFGRSIAPLTDASYRTGSSSFGWAEMWLSEVGGAPSAAANKCVLYCVVNGAKTELYARFQSGAAQLLAAEP